MTDGQEATGEASGESQKIPQKNPSDSSSPAPLLAWSLRAGKVPQTLELFLQWAGGEAHLRLPISAAYDLSDKLITHAAISMTRASEP
jgi:hypothetical protein